MIKLDTLIEAHLKRKTGMFSSELYLVVIRKSRPSMLFYIESKTLPKAQTEVDSYQDVYPVFKDEKTRSKLNQGYSTISLLDYSVLKDGDEKFKLIANAGVNSDVKELVFTCDDEMQRNVWITRIT